MVDPPIVTMTETELREQGCVHAGLFCKEGIQKEKIRIAEDVERIVCQVLRQEMADGKQGERRKGN